LPIISIHIPVLRTICVVSCNFSTNIEVQSTAIPAKEDSN